MLRVLLSGGRRRQLLVLLLSRLRLGPLLLPLSGDRAAGAAELEQVEQIGGAIRVGSHTACTVVDWRRRGRRQMIHGSYGCLGCRECD